MAKTKKEQKELDLLRQWEKIAYCPNSFTRDMAKCKHKKCESCSGRPMTPEETQGQYELYEYNEKEIEAIPTELRDKKSFAVSAGRRALFMSGLRGMAHRSHLGSLRPSALRWNRE
jgi:hypothetical protein